MAFASISGFTSVLSQDEVIERTGGIPPTGPNMWCASLISGLFSMHIPGPGVTLTSISLAFHNRIHVGDRILVKSRSRPRTSTKVVSFDCEAHNGAGLSIFTGTAQAIPPTKKLRWSTLPVPQLIVNNPYRRYNEMIARATAKPAVRTAIAWPCDEVSLGGAIQAYKDKLIVPVLVGAEDKIREVAKALNLSLDGVRIVDVSDSRSAAARAVELARKGEVQMLMKGSLHTDEIMGAVVSREGGMRTGRRISHVFALDVPSYHKTLFVTDAAINIQPDLETKISILQNAIDMMNTLEIENPKVAILSAVESPSTPPSPPRSMPPPSARWSIAARSPAQSSMGPSPSTTPSPATPPASRKSIRRSPETSICSWFRTLKPATFSSRSSNTWPAPWLPES